ncbi:MAG: hypothetical protein K8W52_25655 [Deltaproteobacteria bacterium]|nr:hypothetical protein [Deltaproteobacteria bacterium]
MKLVSIAAILLLACASSKNGPDASAPPDDAATDGNGADAPVDAAVAAACPDGQVATSIARNGDLTCATMDSAAATAVRSRCSVYLGQHDSCTGCSDPPTKWSQSGPLACSPGVGTGNTCVSSVLDIPATPFDLATVDLDGDVNDDDKLYTTLHCITAARTPQPAPCAPGWAITGKSGDTWMCGPIAEAAVGYVRSQCAVYLGWQDSCDGCTSPPVKWGFANDAGCTNGAGANDTCTTTTLAGEPVNLFGLSMGGDVDGNDKLHIGLSCAAATTPPGPSKTTCPAGQFVIGTNVDGSFQCADPAAVFAAYVGTHCALFFGWHDSCDGCTAAPVKWGKTGTATCENGAGADDTCGAMTLGAATVQMFGLSPDGNVNGDDTLYVGFRCDAVP